LSARRFRTLIRQLAEWTAIVLVTCLVGEVASRLLGERPLTPGALVWRHHDRWGWHHEPNARDLFVKMGFAQEIQINSHGLREREIGYEKPAGVERILVIGDSSVVAFEVAPDERFTEVAERLLAEGGHRVEIVNAGTRGWGSDQSLLFLEDEGLRYHPDLVLYKWTDNDAYDNATIHRPWRKFGKPWFTIDAAGALAPRGIPVPLYPYTSNLRVGDAGELVEMPIGLRKQALLWVRDVFVCNSAFASWMTKVAMSVPSLTRSVGEAGSYVDGTDRPADMGDTSHVFRVTVAILREMDRVSRAGGARFAVLAADDGFGKAAREAAGLPSLGDIARLRDRTPPGANLLAEHDPHWNALGHRLYGEALVDSLLAAGLVEEPSRALAEPRGGSGDTRGDRIDTPPILGRLDHSQLDRPDSGAEEVP
jgi:hypothetical protein